MANNTIKGTIPESEKKRISAQRSSTATGTGTRKTVKGTVSQDDAKRIKANSINSRIQKLKDDYIADVTERAKFATGAKSKYDEYDKYQAPGLRFTSDRFKDEATDIKSYIEKNRQYLSDEDYSSAMESVNSFIDTDFTDSDNKFNDIYETVQYYGGYDKYSEAVEKYQKQQTALKKAGLNKNSTYAQIEGVVNDTSMDAGAGPLEQAQGRVYKDRRLSSEEKDYLSSLLKTEEKVATMTDDEILARITRAQNADKNFTPEAFEEDVNDLYTELFSGDSSDFENFTWWKSYEESVVNGVSPYDEEGNATEDEKKAEKYRTYFSDKYGISDPLGDARMQIENKIMSGRGAEDVAYYYTGEDGNATSMTWENLYYERKVGNAYKSVTDEKSGSYNPEAAEIYNRLTQLDDFYIKTEGMKNPQSADALYEERENLNKRFEELTGATFDAVEYYSEREISQERSEKFKNTIESAMQYVNDLPDWANAVIGAATGNPVQLTTNAVKAVSGAADKDGWVYNAADVADTVAQAAFMYPSVESAAMVLAIPGAILSGGEYIGDLVSSIGHTDATDPNTYRPINIYDDYARISNETLVGTASDNIQDKLREYGWSEGAVRLATDVYGGVASGLNSIVVVGGSCALFGPAVGQVVASVILSGSAASSATAEAVQNGSTTGEALTYGFLAGCAEYIGEKISLGYFFDNIVNGSMSYKGLRNIMKSFGKTLLGGVVEGSEEVFTDFMNRLSDYAVNADHSQLENAKQMYMRQGLSEEEAKEAAIKDWWKQVGSDFIGGFVGGLLMGGASFGANTVISAGQSIQERKVKESLGRALLDSEYEDEQGAEPNAEHTEENPDGTPVEKKISGAEKALRTATAVLEEGSPYREDAELVKLAEKVIELSEKGKLNSKNKAAARLIAEFTAKGNAVEEKLLSEEFDKSAAENENAAQREGTAESAAANSQQEKYIAPAGRDSSRVSIDDGKIIYVSGKQGGESESMDLAMSLALTSAAEARDAFGIISPRAVQEIGDAYGVGDISGMEEYAEQALMAYAMGYMGNSLEDTVATVSDMKSGARQTAWEQGVKDADAFYNEKDAEIRSSTAEAKKLGVFTSREGNTDTSEIQHLIDGKALSEEQTRFIDVVRKLSEVFGLDFEFYASEVDENGQRHGDAGYIDDSGKIHIDIFAGQEKSAFIARDSTLNATLMHELTHFIHDWSSKAWKEMYNYVVARYSPYGSVQAALEAIRAREELEGRENLDDDFVRDEFMAQCCEALFEDEAGIRDFAAKYKNTAQKIVEWLENVLEKISGINMGHSESDIAAVISQWQDGIEELREKWLAALEDAANNKNASEGVLQSSAKTEVKEETRKSRGERDSADTKEKVTLGMTDSERTGILSKKKIVAPIYEGQADKSISANEKDLESKKTGLVKTALKKIADEFGVFTDYDISDVDVQISFSKSNLKESIGKNASPLQIAKLLPVLKDTVENSIGIEAHSNRYYYDNDTVYFENLLGGFVDGENFVPVRFGLKHSSNGKATLYVMVDQNVISTKELTKTKNDTGHQDYGPDLTESIDLRRRAEYNISQIIPFVNSKDVLRYLPDDMLTEPQKKAKWEAIAETIKYTNDKNDKKYYEFIRSGNLVAAKQMVEHAAKTNGFTEMMYHDPKKSTDVITYDDDGNIIPISERFRTDRVGDEAWKNEDVRYSRSKRDEKSGAAAEAEAKAGEIAKKWGLSEKKTEALGRGLTNIFESVGGEEVDMAFVRQQAESLAAKTANGMISQDMPADISDKLSFLRSFGALSLTEEQRNAAAKLAGSFKEYRSRIASAVKIGEKGEALSTAWEKLSEKMPELFPADTAESDMARVMLQNVSRLLADERAYRMEGFELAEARESLRREIYDAANQYIQYKRVTSGQTEIKLKNVVPRPSVRAVLAEAALKTAKTEEERAALREYKLNLETVNDMEADRNREYSKLLSMLPKSGFSTFTNEEIEAQRKVVEKLEKQISNADRVLKKSALAQPLQQLADREIKAVRKEGTEALAAMRERYKQRDVMDKLRRIMDRARKSVVNPNSKNYVLGRFVEPMEQLIKTVDPAPRMLNAWGETTKTFEEYDRNRRIALAKINEMKALMPEGTDKAPLSGEMQTAVDEANGTLDRISAMLNTRELGDMSSAELQNLYEMIRDVMNIMRSADRQVGVFEGKTHAEAGQELINEAERFINAKGNGKLSLFADYLNPMRLADVISQYDPNSYWAKYMKSLNEGRKKGAKWYMEADAPFDELRKRAKEYISFTRDIIDSGLRDTEGRVVKMTRSMIVSTVMLIEREMASDAIIHIEDPSGGLIIPDVKLLQKAKKEEDYGKALSLDHAHRVAFEYKIGSETEGMSEADKALAFTQSQKAWLSEMKATLEGKLTDYDRQWIEASREFFSKKSKDAINATMLKIGKKVVATEAMYFPMRVSEDFVAVQLNGIKYDASLLSNGALKEITPEAKQPLVVSGVEDVVKKHMDYVSKVYGLTVPLRDFKAAFNITVKSNAERDFINGTSKKDMKTKYSTSVQAALNRDKTLKYRKIIKQLMSDLEAQRREVDDDRWYKILMSNFVASTLSGNISVTMKQAASYFTAGDVVSAKALTEALATRWGYYLINCEEIYKEIDAHTALHWERRRGMSIPELQQLNKALPRTLDKLNMKQGVRNKIDPTKWIQAADVGTTALIWEACKIDVKNQGIEVGTEEYWEKVTALYEKALEDTQPMYDPLHRAQITKGTSPINKVLYMFKTQPLQNFGVMYSSVNRLNTYLDEYRAAKERGDAAAIKAAKEKVIAARNQLVRSTASQLSSLIVFTGMTLVAAAIRGKLDPWRDDDDELTPESIVKRFGIDMLSNAAANYIPFFWVQVAGIPAVKSIYNFFESGKKFSLDEIEISPLQTANDLLGDIADVWNSITDFEEKGFRNVMESVGYLALSVGDVFGLPATNIKNLFYGIGSNVKGFITDGWDWQNEKDEFNTASGVKKALNAGKEEKAAERADAYIEGKVEAAMSDGEAEITEEQAREDAEKALRSSVAGSYKEGYKASYIEAIFDEDETAAAEIEDTLESLGIGFDESIFADWRQQAEDAMLEYDSYGDYVKGKGKLKYTVSGVKSAIDTGKVDEAKKRFNETVEKKLRDIQKKDSKISSSKAKKQAETEVRNSVGSSYKAEWIKLMWQGYYEEADEIQRKLRKVAGVFDNEYFRGWNQKLKELKKEYSSYEEYEASK